MRHLLAIQREDESDVAQTAAMMLVGTLLIGIGSVVRRVDVSSG